MNGEITMSRATFERIMASKHLLDALQAVGVAQWPGYAVALAMLEDGPNLAPMVPAAPALVRVERRLLPG